MPGTATHTRAGLILSTDVRCGQPPTCPVARLPCDTGAVVKDDMPGLSDSVLAAASMPMPFGRFKGTRLIDLPEPYVVWFRSQGFPTGLLGQRLALIYEIKANGLEKLIRPMLDSPDRLDQNAKPD